MVNRPGAAGCCCGLSGFSLMEVLVAISIMGIVYTTLFSLMTTSLKNIRRIEEREKVVRYSQMKLNELVLRSLRAEEDLPLSGKFDESYSWKAEALPLESEEERGSVRPMSLSRIRLTALRESPAGEQVYSLETIAWTAKPQ